jgi:site-specific DNA recombinase
VDKSEFEPRIASAKQRLKRLQAEAEAETTQAAEEEQLRLAIGCLQDFAKRVQHGLEEADWQKRRDIVQTLIKCVEMDPEKIRIVYRISPVPFVEGPTGGILQDCLRRQDRQQNRPVGGLAAFSFPLACTCTCTSLYSVPLLPARPPSR